MGRGIRPIRSYGEYGQLAALEMAEAMGTMNDKARAYYADYYDAEGKLRMPEGKAPTFALIKLDLGNGEIGVIADAKEAEYYQSEFDV